MTMMMMMIVSLAMSLQITVTFRLLNAQKSNTGSKQSKYCDLISQEITPRDKR